MGTVLPGTVPRWRAVDLDQLTADELARLDQPVIALDAAGRIEALTPAAARWVGVTAWQARGRSLARELAWRFGASAAAAIDAFVGDHTATTTVHAEAARQRPAGEIALVRGDRRIYLTLTA